MNFQMFLLTLCLGFALGCGSAQGPRGEVAGGEAVLAAEQAGAEADEPEIREVVVTDLFNYREMVVDLRDGDVVLLNRRVPHIHDGSDRIEWSFDGQVLEVGGRVVGLLLDGEPSHETIEQHRGELSTIIVRGSGGLSAGMVMAIAARSAERVALASGTSPA